MRKLMVLVAFFALLCWVGRAEPQSAWETCANQAMIVEFAKPDKEFLERLCAFYGKPMKECVQIMGTSSKAQSKRIVTEYLQHAVIYPECGTPE